MRGERVREVGDIESYGAMKEAYKGLFEVRALQGESLADIRDKYRNGGCKVSVIVEPNFNMVFSALYDHRQMSTVESVDISRCILVVTTISPTDKTVMYDFSRSFYVSGQEPLLKVISLFDIPPENVVAFSDAIKESVLESL